MRKDAAAQFIQDAKQLRIITMRVVKKFPKSYRYISTNNILTLAANIYTNCVKANSIFISKAISEQDFELRHRYLKIAYTDTSALLSEITFLFALIDEGNNFFKNKDEYIKMFSSWTEIGTMTLNRINAVINSDKERWNKYHS